MVSRKKFKMNNIPFLPTHFFPSSKLYKLIFSQKILTLYFEKKKIFIKLYIVRLTQKRFLQRCENFFFLGKKKSQTFKPVCTPLKKDFPFYFPFPKGLIWFLFIFPKPNNEIFVLSIILCLLFHFFVN